MRFSYLVSLSITPILFERNRLGNLPALPPLQTCDAHALAVLSMALRSFMAARQSLLAGRRALTRQPLAVSGLLQRRLSTEAGSEPAADKPAEKPAPTEAVTGVSSKMEFQAETKKLLDIVAKSLYTDKEVFVRELVSNSSDALEKRRHASLTSDGPADDGSEMAIRISCDPEANTLTIQDSGVGMTKEDLVENLGTIARSNPSLGPNPN